MEPHKPCGLIYFLLPHVPTTFAENGFMEAVLWGHGPSINLAYDSACLWCIGAVEEAQSTLTQILHSNTTCDKTRQDVIKHTQLVPENRLYHHQWIMHRGKTDALPSADQSL